jgi:hypothetical protein
MCKIDGRKRVCKLLGGLLLYKRVVLQSSVSSEYEAMVDLQHVDERVQIDYVMKDRSTSTLVATQSALCHSQECAPGCRTGSTPASDLPVPGKRL